MIKVKVKGVENNPIKIRLGTKCYFENEEGNERIGTITEIIISEQDGVRYRIFSDGIFWRDYNRIRILS